MSTGSYGRGRGDAIFRGRGNPVTRGPARQRRILEVAAKPVAASSEALVEDAVILGARVVEGMETSLSEGDEDEDLAAQRDSMSSPRRISKETSGLFEVIERSRKGAPGSRKGVSSLSRLWNRRSQYQALRLRSNYFPVILPDASISSLKSKKIIARASNAAFSNSRNNLQNGFNTVSRVMWPRIA